MQITEKDRKEVVTQFYDWVCGDQETGDVFPVSAETLTRWVEDFKEENPQIGNLGREIMDDYLAAEIG